MEAQDRWAYYAKKPDVSECEDDTRWIAVVVSTERTALNLKKYKCKTQKFFGFFLVQQYCGICKKKNRSLEHVVMEI